MGDAEQLNGPHSGESESNSKERQELPAAPELPGQRPASVPPSQAKVRRSSLRPAPADYIPSVRDPSTLRPMMVVRAGDAESTEGHLPLRSVAVEQTQRPPPSSADLQAAGATAEQAAAGGLGMGIPPAPPLPADFMPESARPGLDQGSTALAERESAPDGAVARSAVAAAESGYDPAMQQRHETGADSMAQSTSVAVPKQSRFRFLAVALFGVAVMGGVVTLQLRKRGVPSAVSDTRAHVESRAQPVPSAATVALPNVDPAPNARSEGPIASNVAEQERAQEPEATAPEAVPSSTPGTTRVRLEVKPIDAKVIHRGREVPGPPFEFDVKKGQKIAVEVVRFGFVTARVVIDDKKPVVNFGMLRAKYKK